MRVRIDSDTFEDQDPSKGWQQSRPEKAGIENGDDANMVHQSTAFRLEVSSDLSLERAHPLTAVQAYMNQDGLGAIGWWEEA